MWQEPGRLGAGSAAESSHLTHKQETKRELIGNDVGVYIIKACSNDTPPPTWPHLLILP